MPVDPKIPITRHLPGLALRDAKNNIPFYRGKVVYASDRIQWVESNHPEHKLVFLIGETFVYWCPTCLITVWETEVMAQGARICPFCRLRVLALSPGDQVRLHYRYSTTPPKGEAMLRPENVYGQWWAERVVE